MIPRELIQEIKLNNCVLFCGAGISTEGTYWRTTFYDQIRELCKYPKKIENPLFADVMQYYCVKFDGGLKNKLIREIIDWIEPFCIEGEPNRSVTMFHREIARIPYFKIVVTTNWDPLLERALNVLVPMVEDRDIPFWNEQKHQVLKIHGCITRPQTIIATRSDYEICMTDKTRGAIFTKLRDLMATKTFIFVGYSITDPDFKLIYDEVIENLGEFRRGSYVIDPRPAKHAMQDWAKRGVKIVKIHGISFAREITRHLEKDRIISAKELIAHQYQQFNRIAEIHMETCDKQDTFGGFASSMYQDGLLHSLEHITVDSRMGKTFDDFKNNLAEYEETLQKYEQKLKKHEDAENPVELEGEKILVEIAYWRGRIEALKRFISRNRRDIPPFYNPMKLEPTSKKRYFSSH